jgi:hypothetical protein
MLVYDVASTQFFSPLAKMVRLQKNFAMLLLLAGVGGDGSASNLADVTSALASGATVQAERLARAQLSEHPGSAEGHYAYARVLAARKHLDLAYAEAVEAKRLDPKLQFVRASDYETFVGDLVGRLGVEKPEKTTLPLASKPSVSVGPLPELPAVNDFVLPPVETVSVAPDASASSFPFSDPLSSMFVSGVVVAGMILVAARLRKRRESLSPNLGPEDVEPLLKEATELLSLCTEENDRWSISRTQISLLTLHARVKAYPGHLLGKSETSLLRDAYRIVSSCRSRLALPQVAVSPPDITQKVQIVVACFSRLISRPSLKATKTEPRL